MTQSADRMDAGALLGTRGAAGEGQGHRDEAASGDRVRHHLTVARLEDVERQDPAGHEDDAVEREDGNEDGLDGGGHGEMLARSPRNRRHTEAGSR